MQNEDGTWWENLAERAFGGELESRGQMLDAWLVALEGDPRLERLHGNILRLMAGVQPDRAFGLTQHQPNAPTQAAKQQDREARDGLRAYLPAIRNSSGALGLLAKYLSRIVDGERPSDIFWLAARRGRPSPTPARRLHLANVGFEVAHLIRCADSTYVERVRDINRWRKAQGLELFPEEKAASRGEAIQCVAKKRSMSTKAVERCYYAFRKK